MMIRTYTRRSKNDEGKQQYSLDVQSIGCRAWAVASPFAAMPSANYSDDGISGDDFHNRDGLRRLILDAKAGDVVVCRDQSRLGRDAIEVTLVIRDLVRDRGCRLFYYDTREEVRAETAMDQVTTFIRGTSHQMELEAVRSRVREALRMRVRLGRVAGGRCYGYRLDRVADGGRSYTIAVVEEKQAEVIRMIFRWRCDGWGFKRIAHELNGAGVPFPKASARGSGSWSPSAIRAMVLNPRYRGLHIHGKSKKERRGGVTSRVKADPADVITLDRPEWRIVDDDLWLRAQDRSAPVAPGRYLPSPACKYPLTRIARCAVCGGSVGVAHARHDRRAVKSYVCIQHRERGPSVCPVQIYQPIDEVERSLVAYIDRHVLTPDVIARMAGEIRTAIEEQIPTIPDDLAALEADLRDVKAEQKRLARAVAIADDVPELVAELRARANRARALEVRIAAVRRAPEELTALVDRAEASVKERLGNVRASLLEGSDLRPVFLRLFPAGLAFHPVEVGGRRVWKIEGAASIGHLAASSDDPWFSLEHAPIGAPSMTPKAADRRLVDGR